MTSRLTTTAERNAFRSVKRACYAGLDSIALRTEVAHRVAALVPMEAYSFSTTDPDTGLLTHGVTQNIPRSLMQTYLEQLYPCEDALSSLDYVRAGQSVLSMSRRSPLFRDALRSAGIEHEVKLIAAEGGMLWGSWCLMRDAGSAAFSDRDEMFLHTVAPHIAHGLRTAALLDMAKTEADSAGNPPSATATGVIVLNSRRCVQLRNAAAGAQCDDLADVGEGACDLPYSVVSVLIQLRLLHANPPAGGHGPDEAQLNVRGRTGRWYTLRATLAEPDSGGDCGVIVLIEPLTNRERATILTRLYGLSPREREIIALVMRGDSTKHIAARLRLSTYTVQEHVGHACEKVGVRGRRRLAARLFFDGYATPGITAPPPRLGGSGRASP